MSKPSVGDWSANNMVNYMEGWAWSVDKYGNTVCIGREKMIKKFFETGKLPDNLTPEHRRLLFNIKAVPPAGEVCRRMR
jgi:hypothetical protein